MASLTGQTIAATYKRLLTIDSENFAADASAKYIKDGDAGTASALSLSTTRVGIGTTAPAVDLEVMDTTTSSASTGPTLYLSSNDGAAMGSGHRLGGLAFVGAEDGSNTQREGAVIDAITSDAWSGTENGTILRFWTNDADNSLTQKMCILEGGEVGIGTAAPTKELHIVGTTLIDCGDDEGDYGLHIKKGATSSSFMIKLENEDASGTTAPWMELNHLDNGNFHIGKAYNDTYFTIEDTGNVGIGTTSPLTQLHIEQAGSTDDGQDGLTLGPVRSAYTSSHSMPLFLQSGWSSGGSTINRWNTWAIRGYQTGDDTGSSLYFSYQEDDTAQQPDWDDTSPIMVLGEDGDVGIGIAVPTSKLHVIQATNQIGLRVEQTGTTDTNYPIAWLKDGEDTMESGEQGLVIQADVADPSTSGAYYFISCWDDTASMGWLTAASATQINTAFTQASDVRYKKDIEDWDFNGLGVINALKLRTFAYNDVGYKGKHDGVKADGFIADEVYEVWKPAADGIPGQMKKELIEGTGSTIKNNDPKLEDGSANPDYVAPEYADIIKPMGVTEGAFIRPMIKAIQELSAKVTALENA